MYNWDHLVSPRSRLGSVEQSPTCERRVSKIILVLCSPRFKHSLSIRGSDSFGDHVSSQIHPFSKKSFKALTSKFLKFALKIMTTRVGLLSKVGSRRNRWVGLGWGGFRSCSGRSSLPCFLLPGQLLQVLADTKPCCFSCCCGGNGRCDGCCCCC